MEVQVQSKFHSGDKIVTVCRHDRMNEGGAIFGEEEESLALSPIGCESKLLGRLKKCHGTDSETNR